MSVSDCQQGLAHNRFFQDFSNDGEYAEKHEWIYWRFPLPPTLTPAPYPFTLYLSL